MRITDRITGGKTPVETFVAVLGGRGLTEDRIVREVLDRVDVPPLNDAVEGVTVRRTPGAPGAACGPEAGMVGCARRGANSKRESRESDAASGGW